MEGLESLNSTLKLITSQAKQQFFCYIASQFNIEHAIHNSQIPKKLCHDEGVENTPELNEFHVRLNLILENFHFSIFISPNKIISKLVFIQSNVNFSMPINSESFWIIIGMNFNNMSINSIRQFSNG